MAVYQLRISADGLLPALPCAYAMTQVRREWSVDEHPLWLVFEVEGRLQIRQQQHWIAKHLMSDAGAGAIA